MAQHFIDVLEANRRYAEQFELGSLPAPAARGLGVLTCIDSRIEPLAMLGLEPGDAKIVRNAGARMTDDALRSLVLAANLLEVRRIMVVAHTDCAMAARTSDEIRATLAARYPGVDVSRLQIHAAPDQQAALADDVERLSGCGLLPAGVVVGGFVYDVATGLLRHVVD